MIVRGDGGGGYGVRLGVAGIDAGLCGDLGVRGVVGVDVVVVEDGEGGDVVVVFDGGFAGFIGGVWGRVVFEGDGVEEGLDVGP